MQSELGEEVTRVIFEANGCCKTGARLKASREFARTMAARSLEEKLACIRDAPYRSMGSPSLDENGDLVILTVQFDLDGKFHCACPSISRQPNQTKDRNYCYCCGGHFQFHYEIMLGVKLNIEEVVSSPLDSDGRQPCVFRMKIVE